MDLVSKDPFCKEFMEAISREVTIFLGYNPLLSPLNAQRIYFQGSSNSAAWTDAMLGGCEAAGLSRSMVCTSAVGCPAFSISEPFVYYLLRIYEADQVHASICKSYWVKKGVKNHRISFSFQLLGIFPVPGWCFYFKRAVIDGLITLLPPFPASVNHQEACEPQAA